MEALEKFAALRKCGHENVDELMWIKTDTGAYGHEKDGPLFDWISEHKQWMEPVKKFDVVIQAGGNCGMYARFYKNYFKDVYSFEPCPRNYACLEYNCQGDGYHLFEGGLGSNTDKLSINNTSTKNVGTHRILDKPGNVQMYRVDDLELEDCDLIHLDVEGYEGHALKGAIETIKKFKPVIILERQNGQGVIQKLGYTLWKKLRMDSVYLPPKVE